jgi:hypothetical protein
MPRSTLLLVLLPLLTRCRVRWQSSDRLASERRSSSANTLRPTQEASIRHHRMTPYGSWWTRISLLLPPHGIADDDEEDDGMK